MQGKLLIVCMIRELVLISKEEGVMRKTALGARLISVVLIVIVTLVSGLIVSARGDVAYAAKDDRAKAGDDREKVAAKGFDESSPAKSIHEEEDSGSLKLQDTLPSSYDSRDHGYVTPVRDQRPIGVCWSFATIAAIESSLLAHGQVDSAKGLDLSERQLAYFSYNLVADPLGNTTGDKNMPYYRNYLDNGGNAWQTTDVMASGIGVANEKSAPSYKDLVGRWKCAGQKWSTAFHNETKLDSGLARGVNSWRLNSSKRILMSDKNDVKRNIMANGGVAVLTFLDLGDYDTNWNKKYAAYYNYGCNYSNHLITIVGWDDNFSASKFVDSANKYKDTPEKNGAWLCKNSYGSNWGKDGYYWLSYEDHYFTSSEVAAYVFDMRPASEKEILYQYDGSASETYITIPSGGSVANMFKVKGASGKNEKLKSVCFTMLDDANVDYSIQVYTNCSTANDPTSGTPALNKPKTGKMTYGGFYTIDLDKEITLKEGSTFSVVMTVSHANGDEVFFDVDATSENGGFQEFTSIVAKNQSFKKKSTSASWEDLYDETNWDDWFDSGCAARLKAITEPVGATDRENISGAKIKTKNVIYNGKRQKPAVTVTLDGKTLENGVDYKVSYTNNIGVGTAMVTVMGKGTYGGFANTTFRITPKGTSLKTPVAGKKKMTVKWKKQTAKMYASKVTGYQIQYSTNKKFKNGKTAYAKGAAKASRTIKKLKSKKRYYMRIRTYKAIGKTKFYSKWSKKKSVRVK